MSTTVTYKGATLTTVDNDTVTLETAGKYCEDDFTLTDVSGGGGGSTAKLTVSPAPYEFITVPDYEEIIYYDGVDVECGQIIQWDEMMGGTSVLVTPVSAPGTGYTWIVYAQANGPFTTYKMVVPNFDCTITVT